MSDDIKKTIDALCDSYELEIRGLDEMIQLLRSQLEALNETV